MGNEHKQHNEPEREEPRRQREDEKPQTWKHPDDGTEQARSHIFKRSGNLQTQIYRPQPVY